MVDNPQKQYGEVESEELDIKLDKYQLLSIFCVSLTVFGIITFIAGIFLLINLWKENHYVAILYFTGALYIALFCYVIITLLIMIANIEKNTNKTQEYLGLLIKS